MAQTPADTRPLEQPPYEHSVAPSKKFLDVLAHAAWQPYPAYNIIVLEADCPECSHKNAINKVVPTVGTLPFLSTYAAGTGPSRAYVECACSENHGAPPGEKGCGRWAMIAPLAKVSLADISAADEPMPTEPSTTGPVAEEGTGETSAAERGTGDDDSH
jgi:hypothetical protein